MSQWLLYLKLLIKTSLISFLTFKRIFCIFYIIFFQVGNELGAGKPQKAKLAATVALACAFLIGVINVIWTAALSERWANLFTNDHLVTTLVASVMPLIGICELGNCPQTTGCGILRGTARPVVGARVNLLSFYLVGTPVAVVLAFWLKVGFSGLWFGLLSAQVACAVCVLYAVLVCTDWEAEALNASKLTSMELSMVKEQKEEESRGLLVNGNGSYNDDRLMDDVL